MARRRTPRDNRMGVGGMAGGLQYGERAVVESTAMAPRPTPAVAPAVGPPAGPQAMPAPGAAVDAFAPTQMPRQPMTAGLEPGGVPENDPVNVLRAMYRRYPYPEIRRLIERRDMMQMGPANRSMNTMRGYMDTAESPEGDSWMRSDGVMGQVAQNTMDGIRRDRTGGRFADEQDPDQSQMTPEQQAEAERTMDDIRRNRTGGRFD